METQKNQTKLIEKESIVRKFIVPETGEVKFVIEEEFTRCQNCRFGKTYGNVLKCTSVYPAKEKAPLDFCSEGKPRGNLA